MVFTTHCTYVIECIYGDGGGGCGAMAGLYWKVL